jgi:hypothetical protein
VLSGSGVPDPPEGARPLAQRPTANPPILCQPHACDVAAYRARFTRGASGSTSDAPQGCGLRQPTSCSLMHHPSCVVPSERPLRDPQPKETHSTTNRRGRTILAARYLTSQPGNPNKPICRADPARHKVPATKTRAWGSLQSCDAPQKAGGVHINRKAEKLPSPEARVVSGSNSHLAPHLFSAMCDLLARGNLVSSSSSCRAAAGSTKLPTAACQPRA